ncbi:MAG: sigma-54 dependent transcriptional regulator [Planctomycetota bacterium]
MDSQHVLVVDDEPSICWALEKMLKSEGHSVAVASSAEEGLRSAAEKRPALVILDVRLPKQDGISALPEFLKVTDHAPVVIITAFGDLETAVAAVKNGATDYLTKPFKLEDALRTCRQWLAKSKHHTAPVPPEPMQLDGSALVGTSPTMQHVFRQIALVADSDLSVLITGETGTGKELVASAIHRHSHRSDQTYLAVAPVSFNEDLIESELFGHVKGAFTGADDSRAGLFERAEGGTILLDEIGDLPLATQVKLLRVLEQGQYSRVGEVQPRQADVRIIAATNCNLHRSVAENQFREDLFHRLAGVQIHLPPLRERSEDLFPLCKHFLSAMKYPSAEEAIDESLINELGSRPWHGNIRELRNAVEHAAVVARGRPLSIADFPKPHPGKQMGIVVNEPTLEGVIEQWTRNTIAEAENPEGSLHSEFMASAEAAFLKVVLQHTKGNRGRAAELLGIHRGTLRERLRGYGLDG